MDPTVQRVLESNREILSITEAKTVFKSYGLPVHESFFVKDLTEIESILTDLQYPVVMKVVSTDISHKTDVGGVKLNIFNDIQLKQTYNKMKSDITKLRPDAIIDGFLIESQIQNGLELIIGTFNDPVFGQTIMFGLGGVFVELLKDISFRLIPLNRDQAESMIDELKFSKLLDGFRGSNPVNRDQLVDLMIRVSKCVEENPIKELDLNPLIIYENKFFVIDARIVLMTQ